MGQSEGTHEMKPVLNQSARFHQKPYPIIALTGGIASGKSTLAQAARDLGYPVISADELVKRIYTWPETLAWLQQHFPDVIKESKVDFQKLRALFFSDNTNQELIERFIYQRLPKAFEEKEKDFSQIEFLIYEIPLLFEKKLSDLFDVKVLSWVPREKQIQRLKSRSPELTERDIESFLNAQIPLDEKKNKVDHVFDNSAPRSEAELSQAMKLFWQQLIEG